MSTAITGGCQCGAVRYRADRLGRPSICHCRMCQKAFGAFYGPLVHAHALTWTRGEPKWFRSSNKVRRGFCADCGTPLTFDYGGPIEVSIGSLDDPALGGELTAALESTRAHGFGGGHSLCHGDFGNLELFVAAAEALQQPALLDQARHVASALLAGQAQSGWRCGVPGGVETPGLMVGIAGIGYALLRLANPSLTPSVLQMAPPRCAAG